MISIDSLIQIAIALIGVAALLVPLHQANQNRAREIAKQIDRLTSVTQDLAAALIRHDTQRRRMSKAIRGQGRQLKELERITRIGFSERSGQS